MKPQEKFDLKIQQDQILSTESTNLKLQRS